MGKSARARRTAFETAIAVATCGPPITVTPTASKRCLPTASNTERTASRSMLPSISIESWLPSSAAAIVMIDSGKRAWRRDVIVGFTSSTSRALMTASARA